MNSIHAQIREVKPVEVEISVGATVPLDGGYHNGNAMFDAGALGLDLRYNIGETPWDCGAFLHLDCAFRSFPQHNDGQQNNRTLSIGLLGNYNFCQGSKINPFAGMGVGVGIHDVVGGRFYNGGSPSAVFIPKAGVEFLYFLRLNAYCQISRKGYNTFGLSLGLTIGGWPKKNKG
ncbi:MAG: hypothetical protein K2L90_00555 [Muribaculaceae bacterium]|nr:hypothetical protein [Muribaculaceae bacterium]